MKKRFILFQQCVFLALLCFVQTLGAAAPVSAVPSANPTAYAALRAVQKSLGDKSLERVVSIVGRDGAPQPFLWRVTLKEPAGLREVEVTGGKIAGQHVLKAKTAGEAGPLKLTELNLDSSGAFDAADAQARKTHVRFDSLNYTLEAGGDGKPVWLLELLNEDGISVGKIHLAANSGATTSVEGRLATAPAPSPSTVVTGTVNNGNPAPVSQPVTVAPPPPPPVVVTPGAGSSTTTTTTTIVSEQRASAPPEEEEDQNSGFFTRTGRTLDHTNHTVVKTVGQTNDTVKRTIRHTGATIQRFFVGHSDLDQEEPRGTPR